MNWLLDTCVLSEYVKKQPESKVIDWLDAQNEQSLFISVVSIGEIEKGITKLRAIVQRKRVGIMCLNILPRKYTEIHGIVLCYSVCFRG